MKIHIVGTAEEAILLGWRSLSYGMGVEYSPEWLLAEQGRISREEFYVLVHDGRKNPIAGAHCMALRPGATHTTYLPREVLLGGNTERLIESLDDLEARRSGLEELAVLRESSGWPNGSVLAVAIPGSTQPGVLLRDGLPSSELTAAKEMVVNAVEVVAKMAEVETVYFANIRADQKTDLHGILKTRGYIGGISAYDAVLDVCYGSLADYFSSFNGHRARSFRREWRTTCKDVELSWHDSDGLTDDLIPLQLDYYTKYGHISGAETVADRFDRLRGIPGIKVIRADSHMDVIGYACCILDSHMGRLVPRMGAFPGHNFSYFGIAYYALIERAIEMRVSVIHYGTEAYEAKWRRGCRLEPLSGYIGPVCDEANLLRRAILLKQLALCTTRAAAVRHDRAA